MRPWPLRHPARRARQELSGRSGGASLGPSRTEAGPELGRGVGRPFVAADPVSTWPLRGRTRPPARRACHGPRWRSTVWWRRSAPSAAWRSCRRPGTNFPRRRAARVVLVPPVVPCALGADAATTHQEEAGMARPGARPGPCGRTGRPAARVAPAETVRGDAADDVGHPGHGLCAHRRGAAPAASAVPGACARAHAPAVRRLDRMRGGAPPLAGRRPAGAKPSPAQTETARWGEVPHGRSCTSDVSARRLGRAGDTPPPRGQDALPRCRGGWAPHGSPASRLESSRKLRCEAPHTMTSLAGRRRRPLPAPAACHRGWGSCRRSCRTTL